MVSNPPKVSFIPKGPLTREESFMERRRPRSLTGFFAIFVFVTSIGSYAGLSFYESALSKEVEQKAEGIASAQREFLQAPEINQAKVFRVRADLARKLLDQHIVVSPVFSFLSNTTLGSILYDSFAFKHDHDAWNLTLTGEAPNYASLAYQADVLREKKKGNEFVDFSITNIALTKSATVTFALSIDFSQSQLSYTKAGIAPQENTSLNTGSAPAIPSREATNPSFGQSVAPLLASSTLALPAEATPRGVATVTPEAPSSVGTTSASSGWVVAPAVQTSAAPTPRATTAGASGTSSFWSWFKFW